MIRIDYIASALWIPKKNFTCPIAKYTNPGLSGQRAKKVVFDSLGLVDFAIRLVNPVLNLPEGQVKFLGKFKLQKNYNQCCSSKDFLGYLKDSWASLY